MNRRNFLKVAGSTGIIVAAGSVVGCTPTEALRPWKTAETQYSDPMRRALSYAILAPNPHNRQPWVVDLKSDTEAVLSCDLDRLLPATDPFSRQIVIGLGCFLELFSMAAAEQGYRADIEYLPDGQGGDVLDRRAIAHLSLSASPDIAADPLFAHVLQRHTNRNPYDMDRTIDESILARIRQVAQGTVRIGTPDSAQQRDALMLLTRDAMVTEYRTPQAMQESIDLMRIGRAEIDANPDGIALRGAFLETLNMIGLLSREELADPASQSYQMGLDMIEKGAMASMGFVWITTATNDRRAQIESGRAYMRVALHVAGEGLAMQPMSQALQEYSAMAPYYETIHDTLTNQAGERVQMLARLGYARNVDPAPRWPLATRIKES